MKEICIYSNHGEIELKIDQQPIKEMEAFYVEYRRGTPVVLTVATRMEDERPKRSKYLS